VKCEKVNINWFLEAWFDQDYEHISKLDFEIVYAEYIDLAGLYQCKEFELTTLINYLKNRIQTLGVVIYSQEIYFEIFQKPYIPGLEFIKDKFGLNYIWEDDKASFFSFLRKLRNSQRTKETELKRKQFEFDKIKEDKKEGDVSKVQSRHEFIKMLNSFSKNGYRIERDKTTIEELALMIKAAQDEATEYKAKSLTK
jgi:hypothetical protein